MVLTSQRSLIFKNSFRMSNLTTLILLPRNNTLPSCYITHFLWVAIQFISNFPMLICKFLLLVIVGVFNDMFQLNMLFNIKCNKIMTCEPVMI